MTNQQLGAREERTKLLAEIKQAIEKELGNLSIDKTINMLIDEGLEY